MKIRLCYASTRKQSDNDLIEDLNDILNTARDFNSKNLVFGVLYYANNHFFQCLEGERSVVLELFQNIMKDSRHTDIIEYNVIQIDLISFKNWSMKYVQKCSKVDMFFNQLGYEQFTPSALNDENLSVFIAELLNEKQSRLRKKVGLNQRGISNFL